MAVSNSNCGHGSDDQGAFLPPNDTSSFSQAAVQIAKEMLINRLRRARPVHA